MSERYEENLQLQHIEYIGNYVGEAEVNFKVVTINVKYGSWWHSTQLASYFPWLGHSCCDMVCISWEQSEHQVYPGGNTSAGNQEIHISVST